MTLRYFVTGGAGFIGSALTSSLIATGHEVIVYDNFERGRRDTVPTCSSVEIAEGDIRDRGHVGDAIAASRPHFVVHLAALHFIPDCISRPADTLEINVEGTRNVLDGCTGGDLRGVIFASSGAVYAPTDDACRESTSAVAPSDVYGKSKALAERLLHAWHGATGVATSILRIFNAIGRGETNPHVLPHVLESLRASNSVSLGNTHTRRDYVDTRDIAAAILAVANRSVGCQIYNVGSGVAHSVAEIIELLSTVLARPVTVVSDPNRMRRADRLLLLADIDRIRTEIGWMPRVALRESLNELTEIYGLRPPAALSLASSSN
jgi:UDP-glucose 4-epimerase